MTSRTSSACGCTSCTTERASLEEAYMELTADSVEYGVAVAS